MFRSWAILSGSVMLVFMPHWFTPIEQGYYYTFASLIGLQIFFELGLNYVVMQLVSHEFAHVQLSSDGRLTGDAAYLDRLASLGAMLRKWYTRAALAFWVVVGLAGVVFFASRADLPAVRWLPVWLTLITVVSANLYFSPLIAMLEGCGMVGHIAQMRLRQAITGSLVTWTLLSFDASLYAVPVLPAVGLVLTSVWLRKHGGILQQLKSRARGSIVHRLSWRKDVFPLQWRIALSWISGYFIFQIFSPLLFAWQGPIEAGRVGMGLALFNALTTVGMSWVNAKAPQFGAHVARRERAELNGLFVAVAKRSVAFTFLGSMGILFLAQVAQAMNLVIATRLPTLPILAFLAIVTVANSVIFASAAYMRAHREEPMLVPSITLGMLTAVAAYFGARQSAWATMALYAAITVCVALPWTISLFLKYYKRAA